MIVEETDGHGVRVLVVEAELTGFPGSHHDDQVDSTTQALTHLDQAHAPS